MIGYKVFGFQNVVGPNKTSHGTLILALIDYGAWVNQRRNSYSGQYKGSLVLTRTSATFVVRDQKVNKSGITFSLSSGFVCLVLQEVIDKELP